ncbi:MAG: NAD-dependent deacylase [Leptospirales bacterium]|nr:NAD-dependent deacylase [Leptospirales bacterium]
MNSIHALAEALQRTDSLAVITGAGVSSESGIPTFRGAGGLWRQYRAEDLATPQAFARDPQLIWEWYEWRRALCMGARPNAAHRVLAAMEQGAIDFLLITQNVDGLHLRAGSRKAEEIHGSLLRQRCTVCGQRTELPLAPLSSLPPCCPACGGVGRPDVLWFGESYDDGQMQRVHSFLAGASLVLVAGTSGVVPIPLQLAMFAKQHGALLAEINIEKTALSLAADFCLKMPAAEAFSQLAEASGLQLR